MEQEHAAKRPRFVRWALMLGIVIILNVFFSVLIALALPAPVYEHYCPTPNAPTVTDAATCDAQGGTWTEYPLAPAPDSAAKPATTGYCDLYAKCQAPYQAASDRHALYAFIAWIVLGVFALIAGVIPTGSSIVSTGLSYGGVLALVIGSISYWGTAGNWLRLVIAAIGLCVLLYLGWKYFRD